MKSGCRALGRCLVRPLDAHDSATAVRVGLQAVAVALLYAFPQIALWLPRKVGFLN